MVKLTETSKLFIDLDLARLMSVRRRGSRVQPTTDRLLISQREACERLGVSRLTLIAEIEAGRLRYVLVGKRRKFTPPELAAYVERQARGWDGTEIRSFGRGTRITRTSRSTAIGFDEALRLTRGRSPRLSRRK